MVEIWDCAKKQTFRILKTFAFLAFSCFFLQCQILTIRKNIRKKKDCKVTLCNTNIKTDIL